MTKEHLSRRTVLCRSVSLPIGGLIIASGVVSVAQAADKVCADMKNMDSGQKSIRESLNYTEMSKDPKMVCGGCGFYMMPKDGCGTCQIFQGPANEHGHCDSWAPKE